MTNIPKYIEQALRRSIEQAGNMRKLAEDRGMDYSTINRFNSGDNAIENMPLKTLIKLFPEVQIFCFPADMPADLQPPTVRDADIIAELSDVVSHLTPREKVRLLSLVVRFGESVKSEGNG